MSERYSIATIANNFLKAGLLLVSDISRVTCAITHTYWLVKCLLGFI